MKLLIYILNFNTSWKLPATLAWSPSILSLFGAWYLCFKSTFCKSKYTLWCEISKYITRKGGETLIDVLTVSDPRHVFCWQFLTNKNSAGRLFSQWNELLRHLSDVYFISLTFISKASLWRFFIKYLTFNSLVSRECGTMSFDSSIKKTFNLILSSY